MRLLLASLLCVLSLPAFAQDATTAAPVPAQAPAPVTDAAAETAPVKVATGMIVERATVLAAPVAMPSNSVFLLITNKGADDRLVGVKAKRANSAALHTVNVDDKGVAKMSPLESIDIPAGKMTVLPPFGNHVMLMGLTDNVPEKGTFPITLVFENAGEKEVIVDVVGVEEFSKRFPRELMGQAVADTEKYREKMKQEGEGKSWTRKLRDRIRSLGGAAEPPAPVSEANLPNPAFTIPPADQAPTMQALPVVPDKSELPDLSTLPTAEEFMENQARQPAPVVPDHTGH